MVPIENSLNLILQKVFQLFLSWLLIKDVTQFAPLLPPNLGDKGGLSHFSKCLYRRLNQDFAWELALYVKVIFFRWDLKTQCIKNSEYEPQAKKKKKMIPILISTIFYFWSPTVTHFWQSVFAPLFSIIYTPPYLQIFFLQETNFVCLVDKIWEDSKFLRDLLYWGDLISFLGEGYYWPILGHFLP